MSKMGQELDRRLEENKHEMYAILQVFNERMHDFNYPIQLEHPKVRTEKVLAKIDGGEQNGT